MTASLLDVTVVDSPDRVVIELGGRLSVETYPHLRYAMQAATRERWADVTLDMHRLKYIDSFAMGALLHWRKELAEHDKKISIVNCTGGVKDAFRLVGFHKIIDIR